MTEHPVRLGADGRLAGIVGFPGENSSRTGLPVVLFLSAGLLHKPGPFRLHVDLSRRLNQTGLVTCRFDLSGIGESGHQGTGNVHDGTQTNDVRAAMDSIAGLTGARQFILVGLCSGAEAAHQTVVRDTRVAGMVLLDGYIFPTIKYYLWHYLPRLFSVRKWIWFIRRKLRQALHHLGLNGAQNRAAQRADIWDTPAPERPRITDEIQSLCDRHVRQLYIFSGGAGDCSYKRQFEDAFRSVRLNGFVDVIFNEQADHMYILHKDREQLIEQIETWVREQWFKARTPATAKTLPAWSPGTFAGQMEVESAE